MLEGWAPQPKVTPSIPYSTFSRTGNLPKPIDWTQASRGRSHSNVDADHEVDSDAEENAFTPADDFNPDGEEGDFNWVDRKELSNSSANKALKSRAGRGRLMYSARKAVQAKAARGPENLRITNKAKAKALQIHAQGGVKRRWHKGKWSKRWGNKTNTACEQLYALDVKEHWELVSTLEIKDVAASPAVVVPKAKDIQMAGHVRLYDASVVERSASAKTPIGLAVPTGAPLDTMKRTLAQDAIMKALMDKKTSGPVVYSSDSVISALMACGTSVNAWDIIVTKRGDTLVLDSRTDSILDSVIVNETGTEPLPEDPESINCAPQLADEATLVNTRFQEQVLGARPVKVGATLPFAVKPEHAPIATAFRYRAFTLPGGDEEAEAPTLVVRCGVSGGNASKQFVAVHAFTEFDSKYTGLEWRPRIDTQRGLLLANQFNNNSFKVTRWLAEAWLAGVAEMRFGYVSRTLVHDNSSHEILGVQRYTPAQLGTHIKIRESMLWGALNNVISTLRELPDGDYIVYRAIEEPALQIYRTDIEVTAAKESSEEKAE